MNFFISTYPLILFIVLINILRISATCINGNSNDVDKELLLTLIDRMDLLEARETDHLSEIASLRDTVKHLRDRVAELEKVQNEDEKDKEVDFGRNVQETITERGGEMSGIGTVEKQIDTTFSDIIDNTMLNLNNASKTRHRRQDEIDNVAFYAVVDTHHLKNLGANQRLEFDRIVTNVGNGYRSGLGVFISPVGGTYVFTTTLMGVNHDNNHYYIAVNGNAVANMFIHGQDSYFNSVSRTIVLKLKPGDEVSVNNMNVTEGVFGYQFSSFAGFLLYPDISAKFIVG